MDYNQWTAIQHNQNQENPNPHPQLYANSPHYPSYNNYPYYPPQPQNPNPNNNPPQYHYQPGHEAYYSVPVVDTTAPPPGVVDPYPYYSTSYPQPHYHGWVPEAQHQHQHQHSGAVTYAHCQSVTYVDPNAGSMGHNWGVNEAVAPPTYYSDLPAIGTEQFVPAVPNSGSRTNQINRPKGTWKRRDPKTKVVQSAWCEVCKVCCDTKDVLDMHKLGKKHQKNLEKLQEASMPAPGPASAPIVPPGQEKLVIGPPENPAKVRVKKATGMLKNSQKKVVKFVRCEVCNVTCDTKEILDVHISGKKHKKNLEKLNGAAITVTAPAPVPAALPGSDNPAIGPSNNHPKKRRFSRQEPKMKAPESQEDLDLKRRKVMESGAAVTAVRTCTICNVVCNSETVFKYHLAGQKHLAVMKRLASSTITGIPTAT